MNKKIVWILNFLAIFIDEATLLDLKVVFLSAFINIAMSLGLKRSLRNLILWPISSI